MPTAVIWRVMCGCICALLLLTPCETAFTADFAHSTLIYSNGREFKTDLLDARLLGELQLSGDEGPILVLSGRRPDPPCADCDAETKVYFQSTTDEPGKYSRSLFPYPGNYYAKGKWVASVRMFIGHCINSQEGAAWFIRGGRTFPSNLSLSAQVAFDFVAGTHWNGELSIEFPWELDVSVAQAAVASNVCKEITPRTKVVLRSAADLDFWPDPMVEILGSTPNRHVKQWMKFMAMFSPNSTKTVFFSPQQLKPTGNYSESFIVLTHRDFDQLVSLARSQTCTSTSPEEYHAGGMITEHHDGHTSVCWLPKGASCDYLTAISSLPEMHWTADQSKSIHELSRLMRC